MLEVLTMVGVGTALHIGSCLMRNGNFTAELGGHLLLMKYRQMVWVSGICSTTKNGHALFLEFDDMTTRTERRTIGTIKWLMKKYDIGDIHIFESSRDGNRRSLHMIGTNVFTYGEIMDIQNHFRKTMSTYMTQSAKRGYWVLRFTDKGRKTSPRHIGTIMRKSNRDRSYAHLKYLGNVYQINYSGRHDNNPKIKTDTYQTVKRREK